MVDGSTVTITAAGTYRLSGTLTDGQVVVQTTDDGIADPLCADSTLRNNFV